MTNQQDLFAKAINEAEAEVERLTRARTEARAKVESLRQALTETAPTRCEARPAVDFTPPQTTANKVGLFRERFRGRSDVFPRRWENTKSGRSGYSPACGNEWVHGPLVLVHRRPLLDQWVNKLAMFLGISIDEIGQLAGGKKKGNGRLDVTMIQSLFRDNDAGERLAGYGQVIVDECHHVPAFSFERVLKHVKARFLVGLTATPQRRDGHHPICEMQLGPVTFAFDAKAEAAARPFEHTLIPRETVFAGSKPDLSIQEICRELGRDQARNEMIVRDVAHALDGGRVPLVLTERKDHLNLLAELLRSVSRHVIVMRGGMVARENRAAVARLSRHAGSGERVIVATGRYIGEGFDDARLDTLFLTMPVSWKGTLIQYTGRRLFPSESLVRAVGCWGGSRANPNRSGSPKSIPTTGGQMFLRRTSLHAAAVLRSECTFSPG